MQNDLDYFVEITYQVSDLFQKFHYFFSLPLPAIPGLFLALRCSCSGLAIKHFYCPGYVIGPVCLLKQNFC
jgi:hypothetical protein